ncbi:MAG: GTP cyclohydrolase II [Bdellovibrionota bacterium]|nr:GTP cyclohydrolase II [Bdellovibrionota bacterium]
MNFPQAVMNMKESEDLVDSPEIRNKSKIPTENGDSYFYSFRGLSDGKEHLAIEYGEIGNSVPLVRLHSECMTGDVFGSNKCDCGEQLNESIKIFSKEGGLLLYLRQEGRGIGLYNKLDAYFLQEKGFDTVEANQLLEFEDDLRDYKAAAQMLQAMGVTQIKLVTNNPEKVAQLESYGITVVERIPTGLFLKKENAHYLKTKKSKSGHLLNIPH